MTHGVHDRGGMERACAELIRRTSDRFAFVLVAADVDPGIRALVDACIEVRVPRRPMPLRLAAFFVKGGWALRRVRADLVHTVGAIVPNRADLASVHFCHAGYRDVVGFAGLPQPSLARRASGALARWEARVAERWCYRPARLRALAAVSRGVAGEAARHFPRLPVIVTSNGVDTERFRPSPAVRAQVRAELGTAEAEVVALFVGGDWRRKGLELAIGGLAAAARAEPPEPVGSPEPMGPVGAGGAPDAPRSSEPAGPVWSPELIGPVGSGGPEPVWSGGSPEAPGPAGAPDALGWPGPPGAALRLWVVGAGDEAEFRGIAGRLGVGGRATFFGPREDTARFYQAADLFVLPSAYETFSIASFEAASCGLPLVVTPLHGASELAGRDEGGLVVERTAVSVGAALARLAGDAALRRRLGAEAQRRAAAYSWERSVASVTVLYEELLERAAVPQGGGW